VIAQKNAKNQLDYIDDRAFLYGSVLESRDALRNSKKGDAAVAAPPR
jgi:hypothetical protein